MRAVFAHKSLGLNSCLGPLLLNSILALGTYCPPQLTFLPVTTVSPVLLLGLDLLFHVLEVVC